MFIDDCGNEFETVEEIENFARKEFYNLEENELAEIVEMDVTTIEILVWIFKNDKEKFIKDYKNILKQAEDSFVDDYFIGHDIEEV